MFITFEGLDGSGKTTIMNQVADNLVGLGHKVLTTSDPKGTALGRMLYESHINKVGVTPQQNLVLFTTARIALMQDVIVPALHRGYIVLCDRFIHSTVAYQHCGQRLDRDLVYSHIYLAIGEYRPDLTYWISTPVEVCQERLGLSYDVFDNKSWAFKNSVYRGYSDMFRSQEFNPIVRIDNQKDVKLVSDFITQNILEN